MIFLLIVTVSSMLVAAIMSVIAWRLAAAERRRSEARIAALSAEIHAPAVAGTGTRSLPRRAEVGLRAEPPRLAAVPQPRLPQRWDDDLPLRAADPAAGGQMFATAGQTGDGSRLLVVAGLLGATAALVLGVSLLRGGSGATRIPAATPPAPVTGDNRTGAAVAQPPLELVALGHERDGNRLIVRGVIRKPRAGSAVEPLTAVVFVFDADGGFVTSARAAVDPNALRSAGETTFAVTVPDAGSVSRYRVSFRSGDRIVPHVDRREAVKRSRSESRAPSRCS
jgi:hypothetical protein